MIYTGNYNHSKSKNNVSISGDAGKQANYIGKYFSALAPKKNFWLIWHQNIGKLPELENNTYYIKEYYNQVLSKLSPKKIFQKLNNSTLLCYEESNQFCHRHIVAAWLELSLNIKVPEIKITESNKIIYQERPAYIKQILQEIMNEKNNIKITLTLEDLVGNAIIERYRHQKIRKVTAKEIQKYGEAVKKNFEQKGFTVDYHINKEQFLKFKSEYQNTFIVYENQSTVTYLLQDNITIGELIEQQRNHLSEEELSCFNNQNALTSLNINLKKTETHIIASLEDLIQQGCPVCGNKNFFIFENEKNTIIHCPNKDCHTTFYLNIKALYTLINEIEESKTLDIQIMDNDKTKVKKLTIHSKN